MKDNSFALAMGKIVDQAEAEQQHEVRIQHRRQVLGRVRGIFVFLFGVTVLVFAFCYRVELQNFIYSTPGAQSSSSGGTSATLKAAKNNAAARDAVVNEVAK